MCFGDRLLVNLFLKPKYKINLFKISRKPGELLLKTENSLEVKYSNERWRKEEKKKIILVFSVSALNLVLLANHVI